MALTAEQWKAEIASDVGQPSNNTLGSKVSTWWEMNGDRGYDLKVQYLYTLKKAIIWLIGANWEKFDWEEGAGDVVKKESQKVAALLKLLGEVKADILATESNDAAPTTYGRILAGTRDDPDVRSGAISSFPYPDIDPIGNFPCSNR